MPSCKPSPLSTPLLLYQNKLALITDAVLHKGCMRCVHDVCICRITGVDAMSKVAAAWAAAPLYPDIPDALRHLNNANIKVGRPPHAHQ
jgi:hypothetical protein